MAKLTDEERLARGLEALATMPKWLGRDPEHEALDGVPPFEIPVSGKVVVWRRANGGVQAIIGFPNGYEASVVRHRFSYGREENKWELGVLHDEHLVYDTPITSDVIGHLSDEAVTETLNQVAALPVRSTP